MDEKLKSHFLNLFNFALSDTQVDVKEAEMLYSIALEKGIAKKDLDYVLDNPHKVKTTLPTDNLEIIEQVIDIAKIILADGKIDIREIKALKEFLKLTTKKDLEVIENIIEIVIDRVKENGVDDNVKLELLNIIERGQNG